MKEEVIFIKFKIIIMIIVMLITLSLSACGIDKQISEINVDNTQKVNSDNITKTDVNNIAKTNVSVTREQSNVPYLGYEEITPLFKGRNSIRDWLKDIKASDTDYVFYKEGTTGMTILDVRSSRLDTLRSAEYYYNIASFYVEENTYADFLFGDEDGVLKTLPDEILDLEVTEVIYLDFDNMGIYFNVRDIVKGTSVDDVKRAFLDMKREIDTTAVPYQELYNIKDVDPNIKIEPYYENYSLIGGTDSVYIDQNGFREITYYHTEFYDDENSNYSIWHSQSMISFSIDTNGKVVGLLYKKYI